MIYRWTKASEGDLLLLEELRLCICCALYTMTEA